MQLRALTLLLAGLLYSFVSAQEATTTDADGNSIVISVDADESSTETLSTISSTSDSTSTTSTTSTSDDSGGVTLPAAVGDGARTTSSAPATTYASYETLADGGQSTHWLTFVATTPSTEAPLSVPSGTVMNGKDYLASLSSEAAAVKATHSGASPNSGLSKSLLLAAVGVPALALLAL